MQHFRLVKGWKKEIEDISLVAVIIVFLVMSANAVVAANNNRTGYIAGGAAAAASALTYYGRVITFEQCTTVVLNGMLCNTANRIAPFVVILTDGKPPLATYVSGTSMGILPIPVPGAYVLGLGIPTGAAFQLSLFWMFPK